jgi:hypothetical protein
LTHPVDADPGMPDALEVAAHQDAYFASTGKRIGPLHGVIFSIKDQYDTFDMRTTAGMDAAYANDRGEIRVKHLYGALDAGLAVNPALVENQIEGMLIQGDEPRPYRAGSVHQNERHQPRLEDLSGAAFCRPPWRDADRGTATQ